MSRCQPNSRTLVREPNPAYETMCSTILLNVRHLLIEYSNDRSLCERRSASLGGLGSQVNTGVGVASADAGGGGHFTGANTELRCVCDIRRHLVVRGWL